MRATHPAWILWIAIAFTGCGGGSDDDEEPEEPPMRVEDTAVGDLVTTPGRVQDRTDAAVDIHREALDSQIEASEGSPEPREPSEE
ncbi:MAG: hypothetical protein ACRETX_16600 [Steroidobacteraceae bacterium]